MEHSPISIKNMRTYNNCCSGIPSCRLGCPSAMGLERVAPCAKLYSTVSVAASAKAFGPSSAMNKSVRRLPEGAMQRECNVRNLLVIIVIISA